MRVPYLLDAPLHLGPPPRTELLQFSSSEHAHARVRVRVHV